MTTETTTENGNGKGQEAVVTAITKVEARVPTPSQMLTAGTEQAKALCELIEKQKLFVSISGRRYVKVEGWVPLARMNGVIPREVSNEKQEDGSYIARVQLVRVDDGVVLTEASAECGGPDEPMWNERAPYARRSMAATRATGKACRLAYSWVVALAGFEPTPAEEMDGVEHEVKGEEKKSSRSALTGNQGGSRLANNQPDSYWTFRDKNNRERIGVIPGEHYTVDWLANMAFREYQGKFYADRAEHLITKLDSRLKEEVGVL